MLVRLFLWSSTSLLNYDRVCSVFLHFLMNFKLIIMVYKLVHSGFFMNHCFLNKSYIIFIGQFVEICWVLRGAVTVNGCDFYFVAFWSWGRAFYLSMLLGFRFWLWIRFRKTINLKEKIATFRIGLLIVKLFHHR